MNKSFWLDFSKKKSFPKLTENKETDILIIGGGISGILLANELVKYFNKIILVEQHELYHGTTGYTTAKVTYQHGYIYHDLINKHGVQRAREYYLANKMALEYFLEIVKTNNIDCDLEIVDAILYALNENEKNDLNNEKKAYEKLGITYEEGDANLVFETWGALKIKNQASFNVVKFLDYLLENLDYTKIEIYENTKIKETLDLTKPIAITLDNQKIKAKIIINASHYPFYKKFNFFFMKLIPSISYALVGDKSELVFPKGIYINTSNPTRSIRYVKKDNEELILLVGNSRDSHEIKDFQTEMSNLKYFGIEELGMQDFIYEWYTQDYQVPDLIPLIGRIGQSNMYLATGFNKWGMSSSFLSAIIIRDIIVKGMHKFEDAFSPKRNFFNIETIGYNFKMIKTFFKTKIINLVKDNNLSLNEGAIVNIRGKKYGMYLDESGKLYIVNPICPHMRCTLLFNNVSKTYDCPCHGSRFSYDGKCIDGPSKKNLKLLKIKMK